MVSRAVSLVLLFCLACALLVACQSGPQLNTQPGAVTTLCPSAGAAQPAVMPPLTPGKHLSQVYYTGDTQSDYSLFERVDPASRAVTQIARLRNVSIRAAQPSSDGQWILFSLLINDPHPHMELRIIRMDGQYQQTLYCIPTSSRLAAHYESAMTFTWSPDMKSIALMDFDASSGFPIITRLDLSTGLVQTLIKSVAQNNAANSIPQVTETYYPLKWLDNTHLYLIDQQQPSRGGYQNDVSLLDSAKGANQERSDLQRILSGGDMTNGPSYCDFDSSPDGSQLYVARCTRNEGGVQPQGSITVQPATGGQPRTIFSTHDFGISGIRAIDAHTLLLLTNPQSASGDAGQDLWKINSDGTGLTHLASGLNMVWCGLENTQCANVAPDGSRYGLIGFDGNGADQLLAGLLSDKQASSVMQLTSLYTGFIGWTML